MGISLSGGKLINTLKLRRIIYAIAVKALHICNAYIHHNFTKIMKVRTMAMSKKDMEKKKNAKREKIAELEKLASSGSKDAKKKLAKEKKKK